MALVGLLLIGLAGVLRGMEHPAQWIIPADQIAPENGQAWIVDLKNRLEWPWQSRGDSDFDPARSDLRLYEDGQPLGPPHTLSEEVRQDGNGRYVHWGRILIFSTPDGSDPRVNGRHYRVEFTAGVNRLHQNQALTAGHWLLLAALIGLLWRARRPLLGAVGRFSAHLRGRATDVLLASIIPVALVWFAWTHLPPLWNNSDSIIWLLWQMTFFPHHPPLYPAMMALLEALTGNAADMLTGAMIIQQALHVLAVAYVATAFRRPWQILLVSAGASLGAALGLFSYGLFTEGLAHPLLLLFLGATLRLWRDGLTRQVATMLVLTLLVASLARYLMIVLGVIPIVYLLLVSLRQHRLRAGWRAIGLMMALVAGVVALNSSINGYLSLLLDAQQASVLGRPGIYRLQYAYALVPEEQREQWLAELQARVDDPAVRTALPLLAQVANPWIGPRQAMARMPALYGEHPDRLMTDGFKAFVFSLNHYAWEQWAREFRKAVFGDQGSRVGVGQIRRLLEGSADSIDSVFPQDPRAVAAAAATRTGADDPATAGHYRELATAPWVRMVDRLLPLEPTARGLMLGASLALLLLALWRGQDQRLTSLMLALWGGALVYLLALTFITVVLPRYLAPVDILVWLSNAIGIVALLAPRPPASATADKGA